MPFNKISGGSTLPPVLPVTLNAGEYFVLPAGQGSISGASGTYGLGGWGGGGLTPTQLGTNNTLTGQYYIELGQYTNLQYYDVGLNYWRNVQVSPYQQLTVSSDGTNFRVVNSTGCPVGAIITTIGSGATNGFYGYAGLQSSSVAVTIQNGATTTGITAITQPTASAGSSLWNCIIGGSVNSTITFSGGTAIYQYQSGFYTSSSTSAGSAAAGSNYTRPPIVVFTPPPNQGAQPYILPTAYAAISGGAVSAITVTHQGAGLLGLPGITLVNQPGDTTGGGAIVGWTAGNGTQVNSGGLTALWPAYYGTAVSAVPTLTVPASAAATAAMNFSVTSITNTTPGVGYTNAYAVFQGGVVQGSDATNNPLLGKGLSIPYFPQLTVASTTGVTTLAGQFGGVNISAVPTIAVGTQSTAGTVSTVAVQTPVVGGQVDTIQLISF